MTAPNPTRGTLGCLAVSSSDCPWWQSGTALRTSGPCCVVRAVSGCWPGHRNEEVICSCSPHRPLDTCDLLQDTCILLGRCAIARAMAQISLRVTGLEPPLMLQVSAINGTLHLLSSEIMAMNPVSHWSACTWGVIPQNSKEHEDVLGWVAGLAEVGSSGVEQRT